MDLLSLSPCHTLPPPLLCLYSRLTHLLPHKLSLPASPSADGAAGACLQYRGGLASCRMRRGRSEFGCVCLGKLQAGEPTRPNDTQQRRKSIQHPNAHCLPPVLPRQQPQQYSKSYSSAAAAATATATASVTMRRGRVREHDE